MKQVNFKMKVILAILASLAFNCFASSDLPLQIKIGEQKPIGVRMLSHKNFDYVTYSNVDHLNILYRNITIYYRDNLLSGYQIQTKSTRNDKDALQGVAIYKSFRNEYEQKYTKIDKFEYVDLSNDYGINDIYTCLNYLDCGKYISYFKTDNAIIRVLLHKSSESSGFVVIDIQDINISKSTNTKEN